MAFDPDEYLSGGSSVATFDPDAYLSQSEPQTALDSRTIELGKNYVNSFRLNNPKKAQPNLNDEQYLRIGQGAANLERSKEFQPIPNGNVEALANAAIRGYKQGQVAMELQADEPNAEKIAGIQGELLNYPSSPEYQQAWNPNATAEQSWEAFKRNPVGAVGELLAESLGTQVKPQLENLHKIPERATQGLVAGAVAGLPLGPEGAAATGLAGLTVGGAAGMAEATNAASYAAEYSGSFIQSLQDAGVDVTNRDKLQEAFNNPDLVKKIKEKANAKAIPVGIVDGLMSSIGGRMFTNPANKIIGKVGQYAAELGVQAAGGASGEAISQLTSEGRINDPRAIMAEAVGEIAGSVPEVAIGRATQGLTGAVEKFTDKPAVAPVTLQPSVDPKVNATEAQLLAASELMVNKPSPPESFAPPETPVPIEPIKPVAPTEPAAPQTPEVAQEAAPVETEKVAPPQAETPAPPELSEPIKEQSQTEPVETPKTEAPEPPPKKEVPTGDERFAPGAQGTTPESQPNLGPGAANALEFALMPKVTTSTKNAVTNAERAARGDLQVLKEAIQSNEETFQMALDRFDENPYAGYDVVKSLLEGTKEAVSEVDEAVLLKHKVDLMNEREMEYQRIADPYSSEESRDAARTRWKDLEVQINRVDQATRKSGTIWGRLGQFRQRLLRDDYTFEAMERRARVAKDRPLTPEESKQVKEQADKIASLEKQLEEAKAKAEEAAATKASETATKELVREAAKEKLTNNRTGNKQSLDKKQQNIVDALRNLKDVGEDITKLRPFIQRLALNFVRSGIKEREALVNAVHGVVSEIFPELTPSQTRDLISGYGDYKPLDKEPAKVTLRGLKGEMQQIGKIESMTNKQAPKKTGVERRSPTDEERRLIKEVNELKKKGGFEVTDPETQLKNALSAIKTRLQNEIRDLENAITNKVPLIKKDGTIQYDAEAEALRVQRNAKKEEYLSLFPKEPLTPEQQIQRTSAALDRSIESLQQQLKDGKLYPESKTPLTSPEIEAKRARLTALREERETLRQLDTAVVEAKKEKALQDAIKNFNAVTEKTPKEYTVDSERISQLKEQLKALRDAKAVSPETIEKKAQAAIETVKKSMAEYDRRLQESDFSPRTKAPANETPELQAIRAERDAMRQLYQELVQASKPVKDPEAIRLQSYKTRVANRIADLQERLAANDFEKKTRPALVLDKEANDLQYKLSEAKREFNNALYNEYLKKRSTVTKIFHGARDTGNTARAIMTSVDFSAVRRQGGIISMSNPARAIKNIPDMLRAFKSPKEQMRIDEEIRNRPNWNLYQKSGLHITDPTSHDVNKMEEAYMSRWASKIPVVAGSERAYVTFLNKIRADSFDALVKSLGKNGTVSPEDAKGLAYYVNIATGRGSLAAASGQGANLNAAFFSPRLVMSRFEYLLGTPMLQRGISFAARRAIAKEYGKFLIGIGLMYALAKLAGFGLEFDPRSSDFGKIRIGNTRIDVLSGLSQVAVLISRLYSGEKKNARGEIVPIRDTATKKVPYGGTTSTDVIKDFLRSKLSPPVGGAVDIVQGKNFVGQPVTTSQVLERMIVPMTLGDIKGAIEEQGVPGGTALGLAAILGDGVSTYETPPPKDKPHKK